MSRLGTLAIVVSLLAYGFLCAGTTALSAKDIFLTKRDDNSDKPVPAPESVVKEFKLWINFAAATYCNVENWACGDPCEGTTAGTNLVKYINTKPPYASHGYVAVNDKYKAVIVGFRGTADGDAFLSDMDMKQVDYDKSAGAKVHEGFYTVNKLVSADLVPIVVDQAKKYPDYRVIVTGHSLGGAVAILHTIDLILVGGIPKERLFLYSYGTPRVGDENFASFVDLLVAQGYQFFRAASKGDVIIQLPPIIFGFKHFGPEYWVTDANTVMKCTTGDSLGCSRSDVPYALMEHAVYFDKNMLVTCKNGT